MKKIKLTRGMFTIVDDDDFEKFDRFTWHCTEHGYVARKSNENTNHYLHRDITGAKKEEIVDHINGDRLDNRKLNLRLCTQAENCWNIKNKRVGLSGFPGVCISDTNAKKNGWFLKKKYATSICVNGKRIWLGRYKTAEEANRVYIDACKKYHGSFSKF